MLRVFSGGGGSNLTLKNVEILFQGLKKGVEGVNQVFKAGGSLEAKFRVSRA